MSDLKQVTAKSNERLRERYIKIGIIRPVLSVDANKTQTHCYKYPFNPTGAIDTDNA